jgi:hypothetical protein
VDTRVFQVPLHFADAETIDLSGLPVLSGAGIHRQKGMYVHEISGKMFFIGINHRTLAGRLQGNE